MAIHLSEKRCVACEGGTPPFGDAQIQKYITETPGWILSPGKKSISRDFKFADFKESMAFVNKTAAIAEAEGHHPDIYVYWNKVRLELTTHAIGGLSENDFIMAAKINGIGAGPAA